MLNNLLCKLVCQPNWGRGKELNGIPLKSNKMQTNKKHITRTAGKEFNGIPLKSNKTQTNLYIYIYIYIMGLGYQFSVI